MVIPLSFAIYFIFLYSLPVHIEYFYKKTKFIATGTSLAAGINIALNYFFIRSYGYTASAWTTLASYFLLFVFHWFIAKKIDGNPMFPKKTIIGSIIALSTFSAWTILIINHMLIRWISMLLFIVLSLILQKINDNPSLNSVHQYTHHPTHHPTHHHLTLRSASGQGGRPRRKPRAPDAPRSGTLSHMKIYVHRKK